MACLAEPPQTPPRPFRGISLVGVDQRAPTVLGLPVKVPTRAAAPA
jgi:hypothetical protein